jgi:hypothetical protein
MSSTNVTSARVPCACWRLARELDAAISITEARPKVRLTWDNHARLFIRTVAGSCEISNSVYFDLRRHRVFGESHLPARTAADQECIRCRALPLDRNEHGDASSPLSVGGSMALCRDCEIELGIDLGPAWPCCAGCHRPFPNAIAGHAAFDEVWSTPGCGFGRWVAPVAEGASLCLVCALAQKHHDDRAAMIEETLATDTDQLARGAVALDFKRMRFGTDILDQACTWLWSGVGIIELLRLGVVTLGEAASAIRARAIKIGIESPARRPAEAARRAIWREERIRMSA